MNARYLMICAATAALSASGGWIARGPADAAVAPLAPAAPPRASAVTGPILEAPLIAVASDGRVTLRVEQQPLEWVLEQIALQRGDPLPPRAAARPAAAAATRVPVGGEAEAPAASGCTPAYIPVDPARLTRAIEYGTETERLDAFMAARLNAIPLAAPLLQTVLTSAASERVRVAALETWLEQQAHDPGAQRAVLDAALLLHGPLLQLEARQRLDDLLEIERLDALAAQGSP
jgi:hypothetical protein